MALPAKKDNEKYTYKDYLSWDDGERWELINGEAYCMSPAPSMMHQRISRKFTTLFDTFLKGKKCEVFYAPFDVRFENADGREIDTVVQPDLLVVCDEDKLDDRGCKGAPDLIIEILSPSTARKDMNEKFRLYEEQGVKEYWVVYPGEETIAVYKLEEGARYGRAEHFAKGDLIKVGLFEGDLEIDLNEIFIDEIEEE